MTMIRLTRNSVCIVLVADRGIAGNPLAWQGLVEAVARAWRVVQQLGPWRRLQRGLRAWEDRGCGGGYRLICRCRGRLWS